MDEWEDLVKVAGILSNYQILISIESHQSHRFQLVHVAIRKGILDLMQVEGYLGLRLIGAVKDWLECQFWEGI